MTERIDSHQHFWRYSPEEHDWIDDTMSVLRRDFLPADLRPLLAAAGIDGCIAVQAGQTLDETRFLLGLAEANPWIRGVVGWIDLRSDDVEGQLAECSAMPGCDRLVGVRHIAQSEPDDFLTGEAFGRGIAQLATRGLCYDILVFPRQLPAAAELVEHFTDQRFVLDHLAKPDLRAGDLQDWEVALRRLARAPNVACKLSGMATEADWQDWTPDRLRPAFAIALDAFGAERLMFGSDWPVALCATAYGRWHETVESWISTLSTAERAAIRGTNAARWYELS